MSVNRQKGFLDIFASLIISMMASLGLFLGALGAPALSQNAENTVRQTDASYTLTAVMVFVSNNSGSLPTKYENGKLLSGNGTDVPADVELQHYTSITMKSGAQPAMDQDQLWLVTGAECASETGGTVTASSRSVAVLFAHESGTGFEPQCRDA